MDPKLKDLRAFMPTAQLVFLRNASESGEEKEYFIEQINLIHATIQTMPKTYETESQGWGATVRLHYFMGGFDWYITEKDADLDGEGQRQAYGMAHMQEEELGYIDIQTIIQSGAELDLHWKPCALADVRIRKAA